jgi:hypothetical protein
MEFRRVLMSCSDEYYASEQALLGPVARLVLIEGQREKMINRRHLGELKTDDRVNIILC